jgi:hypothetical protein
MRAPSLPNEAEQRLAARIGVDYLFRTLAVLSDLVDGDLVDALIVFATLQANTAHLTSTTAAPSVGAPPDDLRRPLTGYALAMILKMPYETVRRRLVRLANQGWIVRAHRGVIVPAAKVSGPIVDDALAAHWSHLKRLVGAVEKHHLLALPAAIDPG